MTERQAAVGSERHVPRGPAADRLQHRVEGRDPTVAMDRRPQQQPLVLRRTDRELDRVPGTEPELPALPRVFGRCLVSVQEAAATAGNPGLEPDG